MVAMVLSLVFVLLTPSSVGTPGCPDIHLIGVRGSGQRAFGDQVGGIIEAATAGASSIGRRVSSEALEYPAISVSDSFGLALLNGDYERSVRRGVDALESSIDALSGRCPTTDIVLVGYSQGAQVIKLALEGTAQAERIASVVLLADPTRDPRQTAVTRLGDPTAERSGAFGAIPLPDSLETVTIDVCAAGDGICERGRRSFTAHIDGYADSAREVIPRLVSILSTTRTDALDPPRCVVPGVVERQDRDSTRDVCQRSVRIPTSWG